MTLILGFIDTRDSADPHLQSDCDISGSCWTVLLLFLRSDVRTSVLFLLKMRNMYQMQKDVSFITCCICLSVSQLKTDKQIVQSILNDWHCHHRRSMLASQEMTNEKFEMKILFFLQVTSAKKSISFCWVVWFGKKKWEASSIIQCLLKVMLSHQRESSQP